MIQLHDLVNFAVFFHDWYFKGSDSIMDMNMQFKILLQATCVVIHFDMDKDNFLFATTTIFSVAQEVYNGVFRDS